MALYDYLHDAYLESLPDITAKPRPIRIDDEGRADKYYLFCRITVTMPDRHRDIFTLSLVNVPWDEDVEDVVGQLRGVWSETPTGRCLVLEMSVRNVADIRRLTKSIKSVTGRGRSYVDCNWKWITRRVVGSLKLFADRVSDYRRLH